MATKFYLAEIPDDFPATNVKFENMTKPLLAIPAKMVDGKPITIVGYINAGQKKYKANDYGFVEFNDNGSSFVQFKNTDMDTRYSVAQKASGDVLGYLPLETGELVGIVREKEKPILLLIIAVIAALVLLVALITASLYKMVNKPLDGSGSDASSASSEIVIADGEAYDGTMDNGKTDSEEMRFIEFPAFTTINGKPLCSNCLSTMGAATSTGKGLPKTASTQLLASATAVYTITVPETVKLTGVDSGPGSYTADITMTLKGDVEENAVIVVSVDGGTMTNTADKTAAVTVSNQTKSKWSRADLLNDGTSATCKVSAELDPGHWTGTATFSCEKTYK